ncbi:hypothetical protein [Thiothrix fructosivorans]|uniref:DnrO protein n=1 Tax=Thiothrix fructosivorans TaxID=111770 RepID=A0A8B0SNV0_9GAMM|nr:hypothetical protein [Thiothrix fructosivorans]MBO0611455.1 hypothetical protein [Thiothrix fructosivorans]QTX12986.1 hypothetical protein J1836_020705 [Thiothrix fructosivorans]
MNKHQIIIIVGVLALGIVGGIAEWTHLHEGEAHMHEADAHEAHGAVSMELNAGKRWETDEPLRLGMQRIRDAAAQQQGVALASTTKEQVSYLIANCKLDSKADAALHGIIGQLLTGADMLSKNPESSEGMEKIRHALHQYPDYFNHPGWQR